jgi:hypothetical protein
VAEHGRTNEFIFYCATSIFSIFTGNYLAPLVAVHESSLSFLTSPRAHDVELLVVS